MKPSSMESISPNHSLDTPNSSLLEADLTRELSGSEDVLPDIPHNASQSIEKPSSDAGQLRRLNSLDSSSEKLQQEVQSSKSSKPPKPHMTMEDWKKLPLQFAKVYLIIFCMWMGLLSVYWGALYHRERRVGNMAMLVAIEDSEFQLANSTTMQPVIGPQFQDLLQEYSRYGKFEIKNAEEVREAALKNHQTIAEYIRQEVHHQKYWAGMHVQANASAAVYEMITNGSVLSPAANQSQGIITVVYESGRHFSALSQYVSKNIRSLQLAWTSTYAPRAFAHIVQRALNASQVQAIYSANSTQGSVLSYVPPLQLEDYRPARSPVVLGPSELGLVYAQIFSFHQFNFSADLHNTVRQKLRFRHFVYYRILFSQINHIMLALVYGLMTVAFQVPTGVAFGKAGFMVLWATMYLFISASGGLNECAGTLITFYDKKFLLAPWIIFNVVANISPTFAPFVLSPGFYRYGYAMPMFNVYEALKVIFFNTWKGTLGRNYGVLGGWVVLTNLLLAASLIHISRVTRKRAQKNQQQQQQQQQ